MCTAITYDNGNFYFGRTLDNDISYDEEVTVTPRNFPFKFRQTGSKDCHYAIIGMAFVCDGFPLYYDAANEKGLCMAGLNFVGNARYNRKAVGKINLAQFELIPYILSECATLSEAKDLLTKINITAEQFNEKLPVAELHWIIADKCGSITVESVEEGLKIYENPAGVLTNNPPFPLQMFNLNNYMGLSPYEPKNTFSDKLGLKTYGKGMGAIGLPGDLSSQSRFVRAAFTKLNSVSGNSEEEGVNQFFHILGAVEQQRGCCRVGNNGQEITVYTSCCNALKGIYYYTTYENHAITAIDMRRADVGGKKLKRYRISRRENITQGN